MDFVPHLGNYHGFGKTAPYFESWYFKLISADEKHRYAILPGIILGREEDLAFVQVLNDHAGHSVYFEYPFVAFRAVPDRFEFSINRKNQFSAERIAFDIAMEHGGVKGELRFSGAQPGTALNGAEFSQGVISLGQRLEGVLTIDSNPIDFTGGRGYIENIWGSNYPETYLWFQSNHFPEADTALAASIFPTPGLSSVSTAFNIHLKRDGKLYYFAAASGAKMDKLEIAEKQIACAVNNGQQRLEMTVARAEGALLRIPAKYTLTRKMHHPLSASVSLRLSEAGKTIYEGSGRCAALEFIKHT